MEGNVSEKDDVCVNTVERRGTGRIRMSTHTQKYSVGSKGRTRKEKLISKAHTGWEAIMPRLLQWVKVKATGRFSSAINIKTENRTKIKLQQLLRYTLCCSTW